MATSDQVDTALRLHHRITHTGRHLIDQPQLLPVYTGLSLRTWLARLSTVDIDEVITDYRRQIETPAPLDTSKLNALLAAVMFPAAPEDNTVDLADPRARDILLSMANNYATLAQNYIDSHNGDVDRVHIPGPSQPHSNSLVFLENCRSSVQLMTSYGIPEEHLDDQIFLLVRTLRSGLLYLITVEGHYIADRRMRAASAEVQW